MNATSSTGTHGTILVVDDDPSVLVLIQTILTTADYRVLLAAERADAIRMATQKHLHIDLALLDVRMPGMSATALADEMLSLRPNVRVLFMSGFVDEEIIRIKMLDQYAGFLPKPFRSDGLLRAVRHAMEAPAAAGWNGAGSAGLAAAASGVAIFIA
jgi:two-component system, cell cycle sensor histidine kinase and response regulator CckA